MMESNNILEPTPKTRNFSSVLLLIVVLLAICVATYFFVIKPFYLQKKTNQQVPEVQLNYMIEKPAEADILSALPEGIFTEKDAKIISSYVAKSKDGLITQTTLLYVSNKSEFELKKFFTDYTQKNGWGILSRMSYAPQQVYLKAQTRMTITISRDEALSKFVVDITIEEPTKK